MKLRRPNKLHLGYLRVTVLKLGLMAYRLLLIHQYTAIHHQTIGNSTAVHLSYCRSEAMASSSSTKKLLDYLKSIPPAIPPGRSELPTVNIYHIASLTTSSSTTSGSKNVSVDAPSPEERSGVCLDMACTSTSAKGHVVNIE